MKKFFKPLVIFVFIISFFTYTANETCFAAKKSKGGGSALKLKARDGSNIVYGSVLKSRENQLKAKLPAKVLNAIRAEGIENVSISITKIAAEGETSSVCAISSDNADLFGKNLIIDVLPCTNTAGATVTAGALSDGTYRLSITAGDQTFNGTFDYKAPAVTVGNVSTQSGKCSGGTNQISSLTGNSISPTVALSNCSYFNEVQAARVTSKTKKGKGNKSRRFQTDGVTAGDVNGDGVVDDTDNNITGPEDGEIGFYIDETGFSSDIAVSEAVAETEEGTVEDQAGAIDLQKAQDEEVQFNLDENTTDQFETAIALAVGDANEDGSIDSKDLKEASEEDLTLVEDTLKDAVEAENITEEGEEETPSTGGFQPAEDCFDKLILFIKSFPDNLKDISDDELLALGNKVISAIENGDIKDCVPPFVVEKIIPVAKEGGDDGVIEFAKAFIIKVRESKNRNEGIGPDPEEICSKLKEGLGFLKGCKGKGCPPPPCIPDKLRALLKEKCSDLLALVPEGKCGNGPVACNINRPPAFGPGGRPGPGGPFGPPGFTGLERAQFTGGDQQPPCDPQKDPNCKPPFGGPGGFPGGGPGGPPPEGCIDVGRPQEPSICKPCETDNDCSGPPAVEITAKDGTKCTFPTVICKSVDVGSNTKKVCLFSEPPKDPFSCKPLPLPPDAAICPGLRPPIVCGISENGLQEGFTLACCPGQGQGFGGPGRPGPFGPGSNPQGNAGFTGLEQDTFQPPPEEGDFLDCFKNPDDPRCQKIAGPKGGKGKVPFELCVLGTICQKNIPKTDLPEFEAPDSSLVQEVIDNCKKGNNPSPGGGGFQPPPKEPGSTSPLCSDPTFAKLHPEECQPFGDNNFQPPPSSFGPPEECKNLEFAKANPDKCLPFPSGGGTQPPGGFQPPCDPQKDPNCKPPNNFGGTTCPPGTTKCPDSTCQQTCPTSGGTTCPPGTTKCPDSTCQQTCPTSGGTTCPPGTIKCPDSTCQQTCPTSGGTTCPPGTTKCPDSTCQQTCPTGGTQPPPPPPPT